jgi:hypothetical protein
VYEICLLELGAHFGGRMNRPGKKRQQVDLAELAAKLQHNF